MSVNEMIEAARLVKGGQVVEIDIAVWEQIVTILEDIEDEEEFRRLRDADEEVIPWEQAKAELRADGVDV